LYKLLVFDFDGTLVDTVADIAHHANGVLEEFRFPTRDIRDVQDGIGHGVHELLKHLCVGFHEDAELLEQAVASFKKRYHAAPVVYTAAFPGVAEALEGPLKNSQKAILTNKPQALAEIILAKLDLSRHFEIVIGLDAGFPPKPDPASLDFIMKKFGRSAKDTVLIGDSRVDRETARNAGVDFVWVDYGYDSLVLGEEGTRRVSSAAQWGTLVYGPSKGVI
jgi:phosphoglycolate phosphatase